jgi:hypothetical protein
MNDKSEFENKIIEEIKNLIIYDKSLTYGERKSFEKVMARIKQGKSFEDSIGPWLKNTNELEQRETNERKLSKSVKDIFDKLILRYDIPPKKKHYVVYAGGIRTRVSTADWFWTMLFLLVFVVLAFTGKLNFFFEFVEKYLN